jgi:molecular chaperone GrpE
MTSQHDPAASSPAEPPLPVAGESPAPETIPEPPPADPAPDIAALLQKAEAEAASLKDSWLRARAELENVRRQAANDLAKAHKYAIERFAGELLAVKDALEAALATDAAGPEATRAGVELTLKQLVAAFEKSQIAEVDPAGQKFDPHLHMAMTMIEGPEPPNTVVRVFQKGYRLHDRVLRPALVAVAKAPEAPGTAPEPRRNDG